MKNIFVKVKCDSDVVELRLEEYSQYCNPLPVHCTSVEEYEKYTSENAPALVVNFFSEGNSSCVVLNFDNDDISIFEGDVFTHFGSCEERERLFDELQKSSISKIGYGRKKETAVLI